MSNLFINLLLPLIVCGNIIIGDIDLDKLDLTYYRNQFAYVTHDTKLFDISVIDNIKYSINVKNDEVYALISKYDITPIYEKLENFKIHFLKMTMIRPASVCSCDVLIFVKITASMFL